MNGKVVVCAGMSRSGSTFQYNAAREIVRVAAPRARLRCGWVEALGADAPADILIVKAHAPESVQPLNPDVLITSFRDLRAVAGSLVRMGWLQPVEAQVLEFLRGYIVTLARWEARASVVMRYQDMTCDAGRAVYRIAEAIGLPLRAQQVKAVVARVSAATPACDRPSGGFDTVDPQTLLHAGHRSGGGENAAAAALLPEAVRTAIEVEFADWLKRRGYPAHLPSLPGSEGWIGGAAGSPDA